MSVVKIYTSQKIEQFNVFNTIVIEKHVRHSCFVDNVGDRGRITRIDIAVTIDAMQLRFTLEQNGIGNFDQISEIFLFVGMKLTVEIELTLIEQQSFLNENI
jgi:hypothetical protein